MNEKTRNIFLYLLKEYSGKQKLRDLYHTFEACSRDDNHGRNLVSSEIKCINFDRLTRWICEQNKCLQRNSADSMTFSGASLYLIEFKSGDQISYELKKEKMILNVIDKINGSDQTVYENIFAKMDEPSAATVPIRFYLVVDTKEMGISAQVTIQAMLSMGASLFKDPKNNELINRILPDLRAHTDNPNHFADIGIWYSEAFDLHLMAHGIADITELQEQVCQ